MTSRPGHRGRRKSSVPDAKFKVILLGDQGVGKTSLFFRIKDNTFVHLNNLTLGLDLCVTRVNVDTSSVEISLCDTAGCERFRTLTRNFYRNTQAILFVFAMDEPSSLYGLTRWQEDARDYAPTALRFLVGNKSDLPSAIPQSTVTQFASSHDCESVFITSAKSGEGVAAILPQVTEILWNQHRQAKFELESSFLDETVNVYKGEEHPGHDQQNMSSCC